MQSAFVIFAPRFSHSSRLYLKMSSIWNAVSKYLPFGGRVSLVHSRPQKLTISDSLARTWPVRVEQARAVEYPDFAGNKYYEYPNPTGGSWANDCRQTGLWAYGTGGRARRVIKYRFMSHMADYTSGKHRLPSTLTSLSC